MRLVQILALALIFSAPAMAQAKAKKSERKPASLKITCENAAPAREEVATAVDECLKTPKACARPGDPNAVKRSCEDLNGQLEKLACEGVGIIDECSDIKLK